MCKKPLIGLSIEINQNEEGWRTSEHARHVSVFCLTFKFWSLNFYGGGDFVYFSSHWLLSPLIPQILTITIFRLLFQPINTAPIKTISDKLVSSWIVSQCNSFSFLIVIEIRKKQYFKIFLQEKMSIMDSYQRKAGITTKMLNSLKHVSCNPVTGSLYAFPKVILPQKAVEEAKVRRSSSKPIDLFFVNWYGGHIEFIRFKAFNGMPMELSPSIYSCFSGAKRELHCTFLGKKAIIITSKEGTAIFFFPLHSFSRKP